MELLKLHQCMCAPVALTYLPVSCALLSLPLLTQVKVLLYAGGSFSRCPSGMWEYTGGEARLVAVPRAASIALLTEAVRRAAAQQAEAAAAAAGEVRLSVVAAVPNPTL